MLLVLLQYLEPDVEHGHLAGERGRRHVVQVRRREERVHARGKEVLGLLDLVSEERTHEHRQAGRPQPASCGRGVEKIFLHLERGRRAVAGLDGQHAQQRGVELRKRLGGVRARRLYGWRTHPLEGRHVVVSEEEPTPRQQLPKNDPAGVEIRASVERATRRLFWRHVRELALDGARLGLRAGLGLRDTEVDELHEASECDHHVVRGDVPMDDVQGSSIRAGGLVSRVQAIEHLAHDPHRHLGP